MTILVISNSTFRRKITMNLSLQTLIIFSFIRQFIFPWEETPFDPIFEGVGSSSKVPKISWYRKLTFQTFDTTAKESRWGPLAGSIFDQTHTTSWPKHEFDYNLCLGNHGPPLS